MVLVEVVEHLDPGPLAALGPAVFGRLRPPLVVVTTPDAGYNKVMAAVGVRLLHNGLRNRDHRFEWCLQDVLYCLSARACVLLSQPPATLVVTTPVLSDVTSLTVS